MSEKSKVRPIQKYPHGTFAWTELITTDFEGAKQFYSKLFGWNMIDQSLGEGGAYTYSICQVEGFEVAAICPMPKNMKEQGAPPVWNSYVSVDDIDAVVGKCEELKGKVMMPPFDVGEERRMTFITDPAGASLGLWQPHKSIGSRLANQIHTPCWYELNTQQLAQAKDFYSALFGWLVETGPMPGGEGQYTSILNNGRPNGGMLEMGEEYDNIPSHWIPYFAVEKCDAMADRCKQLGGTVMAGPFDVTSIGRMAILKDPGAAAFYVIEAKEELQPVPEEWL